MTGNEIIAILNIINTAYPRFTSGMTENEKRAQVQLWQMMFANDDSQTVLEAVKTHIVTSKYFPSIAEIRAIIRESTMNKPYDLLNLLIDCGRESLRETIDYLSDNNYVTYSNAKKAFEKLPEELRRYVKTPTGLQEWCRMYESDRATLTKNFMKEIVVVQEQMDAEKVLQLNGGVE